MDVKFQNTGPTKYSLIGIAVLRSFAIHLAITIKLPSF